MGQLQTVGKHATSISTQHGITQVTYHDTIVVAFGASGIELNTGGWKSATTKARMNQTSNQFNLGYRVFQKDFEWFVEFEGGMLPFKGNSINLHRTK